MPRASACLVPGEMQKLVSGQTAADEKEVILSHLESCDDCARRLAALPGSDTLVDLVREAQTLSDDPAQSKLTKLIERMRTLGPAHRTTPPEEQTLPPRDAAPTGGILVIACPGCEKSLKVKSELAGKKVKCPQCGKAVPIPKPLTPPVDDGATLAPDAGRAPSYSQGQQTAAIDDGPPPCPEEVYDFLAPAQQPGELGRLGPYRVLKVLGAGGMGVVFQAEDPQLGRMVALKAMLPALAASPSAKQRFLREAKAAAAIKHDHIVTIHQVGEDRGAPFLAMEFLEGTPLDKRLEDEGKLPITDVLRIGREMAEGLEAAHERGLIHRDIKPGNVWLEGRRARVKILDFGLARAASEESQLTQQGAIIGTPAFMAPEQAAGRTVDKRCDLFSLGCVLYRLTTGELPFKGTDTISTLMAVSTEEPPSPSVKNPAVPRGLADLIMQLLAKKAEDRPQSAQEVADALAQLASGGRQSSSDATLISSAPRHQGADAPRSPRRRVALIAGVLALAAAIVAAVVIMRVQAPGGEFILEVDDENVAVAINKQGGLKLIDKKTGREFLVKARQTAALPAGEYELAITDPKAGLEFSARTFSIKGADETARVKVWFEKGKGVVSAGNPFDRLRREDIPASALKLAGDGDPAAAPKQLVAVFGEPDDNLNVRLLQVTPDSKRIVAARFARVSFSLIAWDSASGKKLMEGGKAGNTRIGHFSPDGNRFYGGMYTLGVYDTSTGKAAMSFGRKGEIGGQSKVAVSLDGKRLATSGSDKVDSSVQIWDTDGGRALFRIKNAGGHVNSLALSPDGKRLAMGLDGDDDKLRMQIVSTDDGKVLLTIADEPKVFTFSPDGKHVVVGGWRSGSTIRDAASGKKLLSLTAMDMATYSRDGKLLAGSSAKGVAVWESDTGRKLFQWNLFRGRGIAFAPDGRHLLIGNPDGTVYVVRLVDAAVEDRAGSGK